MTSPILITGAGITGLVAAVSLLENGVPVRIINKSTGHNIAHRGSGVVPRTTEAHKFLGTHNALLAVGRPFPGMSLYKVPDGREIFAEVNLSPPVEASPSIPFPDGLLVPQFKHEEVLRNHIKAKYNVTVELGTELTSYEQFPDKVVVKMKKADGSEESSSFAYLIGADGGRSTVRKQCKDMTFVGEIRGEESMVVGDIRVTEGLSPQKWHIFGQQGVQMFMIGKSMPDSDQHYVLASGVDLDKTRLASSRESFIEGFYKFTNRTDVKFGDLISLSQFTPNIRMVNKFRVGRVLVTGDAAHVHSPTGGQGLNTGVLDSVNLGWKLSLVYKGFAPDSLLDTYTEERLPVIREMLIRTTAILAKSTTVEKQEKGKPVEARNEDFNRPHALAQLAVNYVGSSILVDEVTGKDRLENVTPYEIGEVGSLVAGQRAPDAPALLNLKDQIVGSLFDWVSVKYHTIVIFGNEVEKANRISEVVSTYPAGLVQILSVLPKGSLITSQAMDNTSASLVDTEGHAYGAYGILPNSWRALVIRPDGVIGAIVESGREGIQNYLRGVLI